MQYKEIIIGSVIALLVVAGFIFWERIFRSAPESVQPAEQSIPASDQTATSSSTSAQDQENVPAPSVTSASTSTPMAAAAYRGRPLDEVRFSANALQSMSSERRTLLSADIRKYAKMAQESPEYIAAWLQVALLKKAIEDYEGARDIWVYVTIARPHEATAFLNLGDLYTNYLKDYPRAEKNYQNAIKAEPKNALGYLGLSDLYVFFYTEKEARAEQVLKEGIAASPGEVNLQKALSRLYERRAQ